MIKLVEQHGIDTLLSQFPASGKFQLLKGALLLILVSTEIMRKEAETNKPIALDSPKDPKLDSFFCDPWVLFYQIACALGPNSEEVLSTNSQHDRTNFLALAHVRIGARSRCFEDSGRLLNLLVSECRDSVIVGQALYCLYGLHFQGFCKSVEKHHSKEIPSFDEKGARDLFHLMKNKVPDDEYDDFWEVVVADLERGSFFKDLSERDWLKEATSQLTSFLTLPVVCSLTGSGQLSVTTNHGDFNEFKGIFCLSVLSAFITNPLLL